MYICMQLSMCTLHIYCTEQVELWEPARHAAFQVRPPVCTLSLRMLAY
jgi:hypothetical protein